MIRMTKNKKAESLHPVKENQKSRHATTTTTTTIIVSTVNNLSE
jgi:hypothetical protein